MKKYNRLKILSVLVLTSGLFALSSCGAKGETGDKGPTGDPGINGEPGENGKPGENGATWLSGEGEPNADSGNNGDFYFDSLNHTIYKKVDGSWTLLSSIDGEDGKDGENGTSGSNGQNGKHAYSNTILPSNDGFISVSKGSAYVGEEVAFVVTPFYPELKVVDSLTLNETTYEVSELTALENGSYAYTTSMVENGFVVSANFKDNIQLKSISLKAEADRLLIGETLKLEVKLNPVNYEPKNVTYSIVEGNEFATLENDTLTGVSNGIVKVQADVDGTKSDILEIEIHDGTINYQTIEEIYSLPLESEVQFVGYYQGVHEGEKGPTGYYIGDGEHSLYLYNGYGTNYLNDVTLGDLVAIKGTLAVFNGGYQITNYTYEKLEELPETAKDVTKPVLLEIENTDGITGLQTAREALIKGAVSGFKASTDLVEFKVNDLAVRLEKKKTNAEIFAKASALKDGDTATIKGFLTYYVSKSQTLPQDNNGLQLVAVSSLEVEAAPVYEKITLNFPKTTLKENESTTVTIDKYKFEEIKFVFGEGAEGLIKIQDSGPTATEFTLTGIKEGQTTIKAILNSDENVVSDVYTIKVVKDSQVDPEPGEAEIFKDELFGEGKWFLENGSAAGNSYKDKKIGKINDREYVASNGALQPTVDNVEGDNVLVVGSNKAANFTGLVSKEVLAGLGLNVTEDSNKVDNKYYASIECNFDVTSKGAKFTFGNKWDGSESTKYLLFSEDGGVTYTKLVESTGLNIEFEHGSLKKGRYALVIDCKTGNSRNPLLSFETL